MVASYVKSQQCFLPIVDYLFKYYLINILTHRVRGFIHLKMFIHTVELISGLTYSFGLCTFRGFIHLKMFIHTVEFISRLTYSFGLCTFTMHICIK
jgi:hypothetical protein